MYNIWILTYRSGLTVYKPKCVSIKFIRRLPCLVEYEYEWRCMTNSRMSPAFTQCTQIDERSEISWYTDWRNGTMVYACLISEWKYTLFINWMSIEFSIFARRKGTIVIFLSNEIHLLIVFMVRSLIDIYELVSLDTKGSLIILIIISNCRFAIIYIYKLYIFILYIYITLLYMKSK